MYFEERWWFPDVNSQYYVPGAHKEHLGGNFDVPWVREDAVQGRHTGKAINILFGDTHVATRRADVIHKRMQAGELTQDDRFFWPR